MIDVSRKDSRSSGSARIGSQPMALAAGALALLLIGAGTAAGWRAVTGSYPETDRAVAARQIQARATEASEQLAEKTKAMGITQQEQVDQLQAMQEQMQGMKQLLATQQSDARRLTDQVGTLSGAIDSLRQSFASAQSSEAPARSAARRSTVRTRTSAGKAGQLRHIKRKRQTSRS
jgi:septal ring factor EnvC (AmiA/AmiB activator)